MLFLFFWGGGRWGVGIVAGIPRLYLGGGGGGGSSVWSWQWNQRCPNSRGGVRRAEGLAALEGLQARSYRGIQTPFITPHNNPNPVLSLQWGLLHTPPPPGSCSPLLPAAHSGLAWLYPLQPPPLTQTHARPPFPSLCPFLPLFGAVLAAGFVWASSQRRFSQLRRPPRTRVCTRQECSIAHACAPARCAAAKAHLGTALCTPAAALWHGCISPPPPLPLLHASLYALTRALRMSVSTCTRVCAHLSHPSGCFWAVLGPFHGVLARILARQAAVPAGPCCFAVGTPSSAPVAAPR